MKQIDDQAYKDGGAAFNKGKTLRSLFEPMIAEINKEGPHEDWQASENKFNSMMLGFADAFLQHIRNKR